MPALMLSSDKMTAQPEIGINESHHHGPIARSKLALCSGVIFLCLFIVQGIFFIRANSQTIDEATHLAAGYSYLATRDFRLNPEHPPLLKEIQALPLYLIYRPSFKPDPQQWRNADHYNIGYDFLYKSAFPADQILALGRLSNLFLGTLLVALIGWWAYRLWGPLAATVAMAFACFEPNLVAHSSLTTTDVGVALFLFLAFYLVWEYHNRPTWTRLAAAGLATGMALVSKFSSVLFIPALGVVIAIAAFLGKPIIFATKQAQLKPQKKLARTGALFVMILVFAAIIIPPSYLLQGYWPWISGLQQFMSIAEEGRAGFLAGEYSSHGWWDYFLVSFLIKTPLGTLILIAASLIFYRAGKPLVWREATFLLLPVLIFVVATTQAKINIGVRHILPIYPFLFVLASRLATVRLKRAWLAPALIGIPVVAVALSSLRVAPHQLAYFNELVGPEEGYRYLTDSNLDWGQDLKGLKAYVEKEKLPMIYLSYFGTAPPSYYGIRYQDVTSKGALTPPPDRVPQDTPRKIFAISVYNLQDVARPYDPLFRWLWTRQPVAKIGYSIFVYDLTHDPEGLQKLEEAYAKANSPPAATLRFAGSR